MYFNYPITVDTVPSPDRSDCNQTTSDDHCYVEVTWNDDGSSIVAYTAHAPLSATSILIEVIRSVNASGIYINSSSSYSTSRTIGYACLTLDSSATPCNDVNILKRSIIASTLPTEETMKSFDSLIAQTVDFNTSLCLNYTNMTNECPPYDLVYCEQCVAFVQYTQPSEICATCPSDRAYENSVTLDTKIFLDNQTAIDTVSIFCQTDGSCNSIQNTDRIRQTLMSSFDYSKFFDLSSAASISKSNIIILFAFLCVILCR